MLQSCEDFLDRCTAFREANSAERLDAQLLQLQQQAADVQARLTAAKLAAECVQAHARTAKDRATASEARCQQAAAAQQGGMRHHLAALGRLVKGHLVCMVYLHTCTQSHAGLEEKLGAEKDRRTRLQHQLAEAQKAHQMRNKENERATCAAALTQEAIAKCLSGYTLPSACCFAVHEVFAIMFC